MRKGVQPTLHEEAAARGLASPWYWRASFGLPRGCPDDVLGPGRLSQTTERAREQQGR